MAKKRATQRCQVCKRPSTASVHPSCAKRRARNRRRLVTQPRREVKRRVRTRRRQAVRSAKAKVRAKVQGWWIRDSRTHHIR